MALRLTKKHAEIATKWVPTAMTYGGGATLALLYFTDWKVVLQYVPFYNTKFNQE